VVGSAGAALAEWYVAHGRHELAWRLSRDRWAVLTSEVMLQQTQVARVVVAWPPFLAMFPTAQAAAAAGPGEVIRAWGRLGYPRRARRLWEAADVVARAGWPADLTTLPGVGRYTAGAVLAQCDDADVAAVEVNVRRVLERVPGRRLGPVAAERAMVELADPLTGRDRLLALMDLGATVCTARSPRCDDCPLRPWCATRGLLPDETKTTQGRYEGSMRQRRGVVLATLRAADGPVMVAGLDAAALSTLVVDGLAVVEDGGVRLP
jgi:A/G-specific adenine glycosylase